MSGRVPFMLEGPASLNAVAEDGRIVLGPIPFAPAVVQCALHDNLELETFGQWLLRQ
jgi:hypothetical protein